MERKNDLDTGNKTKQEIILATTSVYRLEIFKKLGLHFTGEGSNVDENAEDRPTTPEELTKYLAQLKAEAVAKNHTNWIVIWFDSVWFFEWNILEKPKSREEWFARLKAMSGKNFTFYSWVFMIDLDNKKTLSDCVATESKMRSYDDNDIDKYLDNCDERYKTHADGFDACNYYSMSFIESVTGNPLNVMMGIPVSRIVEMLKEIGYKI